MQTERNVLAGNMRLHEPSLINRVLEALRLREIEPGDIGDEHVMMEVYRDLGGDSDLGWGNDGYCQSWRGDWGWWKSFLSDHGVKKR